MNEKLLTSVFFKFVFWSIWQKSKSVLHTKKTREFATVSFVLLELFMCQVNKPNYIKISKLEIICKCLHFFLCFDFWKLRMVMSDRVSVMIQTTQQNQLANWNSTGPVPPRRSWEVDLQKSKHWKNPIDKFENQNNFLFLIFKIQI